MGTRAAARVGSACPEITDSLGGMNGTLLDDDAATAAAELAKLQINGR